MKKDLQNLKDVLTLEGDFKPKKPSDFFGVRADFLLEIIAYAEKVEKMQEVLEWYADDNNYTYDTVDAPNCLADRGDKAKEVLLDLAALRIIV